MSKKKSFYGPISYTPKKDLLILLYLVLIIWFIILAFPYWVQMSFNILMAGYLATKELRGATIIFAIILRVILYPLGKARKKITDRSEQAEEEYKKKVKSLKHPLKKDKQKRIWLKKYRALLVFEWFLFCFYTMNAVSVGWIFLQPFTKERIISQIFSDFLIPHFPLNTTSYIPLVGMVNLTEINMILNLISAVGAGLVGLSEVIIRGKTSKRQLLMYLVLFPLGAYFITMWVPSGFEFTLTVFEILTILIIIIEKLFELGKKLKPAET